MQLRKHHQRQMASPIPAADTLAVVSAEEAEAQALAEDRQLEFRARHQLTIDAQAHTLLDPKYAREMRAVPLGLEAGRPVVAVADPSEKRLAALRELVPGDTKFVLVAPESLDALLKSRIFSESGEGTDAVPIVHEQKLSTTAEADAPPVSPGAPESDPTPEPAPVAPPNELFDAANVTQLAEQLAQAADTLLALQTQVQGIAAQFEQTRQELREQKEQLALAAAKADQDRARIKSVAASLAEDVARLDQTKADLAERLSGLVLDDLGG
jgi:MshEN domain